MDVYIYLLLTVHIMYLPTQGAWKFPTNLKEYVCWCLEGKKKICTHCVPK